MAKLIFTQQLKPSKELIYGNLALIYDDNNQINYIACSGAAGRQIRELLWKPGRYGTIPDGKYFIPTKGYHSSLPGINGLFFHIQPDPKCELGSRSELGVHWDGGQLGTAGCIGIKNRESFNTFCKRLSELHKQGIEFLDLEVKLL